MTPSGIEPATFLFVTQSLNKLRHCVPPESYVLHFVSQKYEEYSMQHYNPVCFYKGVKFIRSHWGKIQAKKENRVTRKNWDLNKMR
jgi:hypothetical protein